MKVARVYLYFILLIILFLFLCSACSENLTSDKAKQLILAETKYPLKKIGSIEISQSPEQGILITKDKMQNYIKLLANKLILMNIRGISSDGIEYYDVKLTDEGKIYVIKENRENDKLIVDVLLGEMIFDKIITIRKDNNKEGYNVNYLDEISRMTPFGACLIDRTEYERSVRLTLHKGKWQIDKN